MGKKGKKKKKESEPVDPYAGYLVVKLKFGLGDPQGIEFTCMFRNRKTEEKYDAPPTVGDLFKDLWRQSEQNEEFDEDHVDMDGDGNIFETKTKRLLRADGVPEWNASTVAHPGRPWEG